MLKESVLKLVCVAGLATACVCGVAGCQNNNQDNSSTSGLVAATVDGVEISEDTITSYIEAVREQQGLTDEDSWGEYLAEYGTSPSEIREQVIQSYIDRELIVKGAEEKNITVDSSEVDSYVDSMKQNYEDDEAWQEALTAAGMTEDEYRSEIELQLKAKALYATFADSEDPSEEDMLSYAKMYATAYDGAKRSSHILFDEDDEATAQEVLDKINAGTLDFAEAAKEYSTDTASAEDGGDVGWDKTNSLDDDYQAALDELSKDQVSGLVTTQFGIHIIKCTDVYEAPKTTGEDGTESVEITSTDQIPSDWVETIKESLQSSAQSTAYQTWLTEAEDSADIVINDMPDGLPYYVDMSKYDEEDESTDSTDSTDSSSTSTDSATTTESSDSSSTTESSQTDSTSSSSDTSSSSASSSGSSSSASSSDSSSSSTSSQPSASNATTTNAQ